MADRIDEILKAVLTPRGDPEDGTRDHLPRILRDYLSEECGRAGVVGFNDGWAEGYAKAQADAAPHSLPTQAGEATVSETEAVARWLAARAFRTNMGSDPADDYVEIAWGQYIEAANSLLTALKAARAAAQGAGAQPVALEQIAKTLEGEAAEQRARKFPSNEIVDLTDITALANARALDKAAQRVRELAAAPPDAPRPDIEAARREERERCAEIIRQCFTLPEASEVRDELIARIHALGDRP